MEDLKKQIKKARNIKDSSMITYISALKKIHKGLGGLEDKDYKNAEFLKDYKKVMAVINKEEKLTSKKNKLTAVLVALSSQDPKSEILIDKFNDTLKGMNDEYLAFLKLQKKTDTQKKNWINYADLIKIVNRIMATVADEEIQKKEELNKNEFDTLQQYLILRTYLTFPLRNDFANMPIIKIKDLKNLSKDDQQSKNYLVLLNNNKKQFNINQFKNQKYIGSKVLKIPAKLNRIINLWMKHNKSGFYLVRQDRKSAMNPNNITKFLNRIFHKYADGKKISTSMIRHIVISHMLKGKKTIKQKEEEAKDIENTFFHSKAVNDLYRKVDDDIGDINDDNEDL
jgi:hypothetical protein